MKHEPRAGWIRADAINPDQELELLRLREENKSLKEEIRTISRVNVDVTELASGSDIFELEFHVRTKQSKVGKAGSKYWVQSKDFWSHMEIRWDQIFYAIIPALTTSKRERDVYHCLNRVVEERLTEADFDLAEDHKFESVLIRTQSGEQIRMQLIALGLIELEKVDYEFLWVPTARGQAQIMAVGALRKNERRPRDIEEIE